MQNNKKTLIKILAAALMICVVVFALAACGNDDGNETGGNGANGADAGPAPVSFLQKAETGERNDYNGSVGYEILCNTDIEVTAVGRPLNSEMNQSHTIYIWQVSSETLLASAEVTPDSPLDSLGFKTAQLNSPLVLKAGESYRIVSAEFNEGDMWYDIGTSADDPIPDLQPRGEAVITTPVFTGEDAHGSYPSNEYNPGGVRGYVGATFYYVLVSDDSEASEDSE